MVENCHPICMHLGNQLEAKQSAIPLTLLAHQINPHGPQRHICAN